MKLKHFGYKYNILFLGMKWTPVIYIAASLMAIAVFTFASTRNNNQGFEEARELIVMRNIGHQVLKYLGDDTSRVLPVNRFSPGEFQIPFESSFAFIPDSLVKIIDKTIAANGLPGNYLVNVMECNTQKVIFGYAMSTSKQQNIVPCLGRHQPKMNYCININFEKQEKNTSRNLVFAGAAFLFASLGAAGFARYLKKEKPLPESKNEMPQKEVPVENNGIDIGQYQFFPNELLLVIAGEKIVLTMKETRILSILAAEKNKVIDREQLQKEVWEDEGVIVGRSLDVFISKLRKKLEKDPDVKLINIHGKGYKLVDAA